MKHWSFNRYMVECEYDLCRKNREYVWVLIDTWWNVNYIQQSKILNPNKCFNRYMVECESVVWRGAVKRSISF